MPRARYTSKDSAIVSFDPPKITRLRSTPRSNGSGELMPVPPESILKSTVSPISPKHDLNRTQYGRALNLDRIEMALRSADFGGMRQLTDLSRETIDTDPHLAAIVNKRIGAVSTLPHEVIPATGFGIDEDKARFYSDIVRDQLKQLPNLSHSVSQIAWGLFDGRAALENEWLSMTQTPGLPRVVHPKYGSVDWMIRELTWIHPRRLHFGPLRELRISDTTFGSFSDAGIALNDFAFKFIQFQPQLFSDYQEREGLARRCLYWSFFKRASARDRLVLMELFGKPWRWLEVDEDSTAGPEDLESADESMQLLGNQASFRAPRGTKFKVEQPGKGAGEVHAEIIEESDKQLSKLVLGQTGTTDANPAGLNNAQANVMQDEQFMILMRDARLLSEAIETYLTDSIIALNFGESELPHAPHFVLRADVPLDRSKEIDRLNAAISSGLEVSLSEAYEISGFRVPEVDEAVIKLETPPLHPMAVQPPPERPVIVHPETADLPSRVVQPISPVGEGGLVSPTAPSEGGGGIVGPQKSGAPPTGNSSNGKEETSPNIADSFSVSASSTTAGNTVLPRFSKGVEALLGKAHPSDALAFRSAFLQQGEPVSEGDVTNTDEIRSAAQPVDNEEIGGIEVIIVAGIKEGARISEKMSKAFVDAVKGLNDATEISHALDDAAMDQNLHPMTRSMERRLIQGAMTGALSSHYEYLTDEESDEVDVPEEVSAMRVHLEDKPFVSRPYADAIRWFRTLDVVNRATFDQLDAAAKRRAFTIAGIHNQMQLEIAKDELVRHMQEGLSLKLFAESLDARFDSAGMTRLNPSHVENVYRTNTINAYNSGRHTQMTQPRVLRTHGYWMIRTVNDGEPRQRRTHKAVHGWILSATDPIWATAYPPFGFNCRCRIRTMSNLEVKRRGLKIRTGSEVKNLPDRGFTSGTPSLL